MSTSSNGAFKAVYARDIMATRLITIKPDLDVFKGVSILLKHKISGAPVVDEDNRLLGVFSEKSVMRVLMDAAYEQLPTNRVDAFMDRTPHTITPDTQLLTIAQLFSTTPRRRLPVIEDEKLVGQVSRRDVVKAVFQVVEVHETHDKSLLYLSALREMQDAPDVS